MGTTLRRGRRTEGLWIKFLTYRKRGRGREGERERGIEKGEKQTLGAIRVSLGKIIKEEKGEERRKQ